MVGLYDYIDEDEKYMMTMEAVMNNKLAHLYMEFDKVMLEHQENLKAIEYKILMENGTEDDLMDLYMFEAEETKEKGQGILGSIFGAIRKFFKKVKEFLFGVKDAEPPKQVTVSEDPAKLEQDGKNLLKSLRSGKTVAKIAVGGTAVTIAGVALKNYIGKLNSLVKELDNEMARNDEIMKNKSPEEQSKMKEIASEVHKFGSRVLKIANAAKDNGESLKKNISDKKAENDSRELSKQGVQIVKGDHGEYRVDKTNGNIVWHDENGKEADVEYDWAPENVKKVARKMKGNAAAKQKEEDTKNENKQALNSAYKSSTIKDPKSGYTFRIEGRTGNIIAVDKRHNTKRCNSVEDAVKLIGGNFIEKRKLKKEIENAYKAAKDGIDTANKVKEAMDANGMKYERTGSSYDALCDMINSL